MILTKIICIKNEFSSVIGQLGRTFQFPNKKTLLITGVLSQDKNLIYS